MARRSRPSLSTLGIVLRILRRARGLSQDRLANVAGVDRAYLGGIERAERHPTWEIVERLLAALDVGWAEFGRIVDQNAREDRRAERSAKR